VSYINRLILVIYLLLRESSVGAELDKQLSALQTNRQGIDPYRYILDPEESPQLNQSLCSLGKFQKGHWGKSLRRSVEEPRLISLPGDRSYQPLSHLSKRNHSTRFFSILR